MRLDQGWPGQCNARGVVHAELSGKGKHAPVAALAQLLLNANEKAGTIRPDVTADDFCEAIAGIRQIDLNDEWQPRLAWLMTSLWRDYARARR